MDGIIYDCEKTRHFVIYDDLSYSEFKDRESAALNRRKPMLIVTKQYQGKTKSLFNDDYFVHSAYSFYNLNNEKTFFRISDWELIDVSEREIRARVAVYRIKDPEGCVRNYSSNELSKDWSKYFHIPGLCNVLKMIREFSIYPNWQYLDLKRENELLKKELSLLKVHCLALEKMRTK